MSIDFDDALARSRPESPFSNGTEWECWSANWCDRCAVDAPFRNGIAGRGCRLIEVAVISGRTPAEWFEQPIDEQGRTSLSDRYHCVAFRSQGGGGGGEPRPRPEPPDMDGLFERPERQRRMFVQPRVREMAPC